jgi:hypothetical protein
MPIADTGGIELSAGTLNKLSRSFRSVPQATADHPHVKPDGRTGLNGQETRGRSGGPTALIRSAYAQNLQWFNEAPYDEWMRQLQ